MELIPRKRPQEIPFQAYRESVPSNGRWEYGDGELWWSGEEMRKCIIMLIASVGLERFVEMLPEQSVEELKRIVLIRPLE